MYLYMHSVHACTRISGTCQLLFVLTLQVEVEKAYNLLVYVYTLYMSHTAELPTLKYIQEMQYLLNDRISN